MGKSGDLLRAAKARRVTRTFTREELEQHDFLVRKMAIEENEKRLQDELRKQADEIMRQYATDEMIADVNKILLYTLSISCKVLVERFGWAPIKNRVDSRMRLYRFAKYMEEEIIDIEKSSDLKSYAEMVNEKYGVGWIAEDTEESVAEQDTKADSEGG